MNRIWYYNGLGSQGSLTDRLNEIINYKSVDDEERMILAGGLDFSEPARLAAKFDRCFSISRKGET